MKKHYALKLWLIGIINALAFMFVPPLYSLVKDYDALYGLDGIFVLLLLISCGVTGYVNFVFIRKVFDSDLQNMKFRHALLPLAGWLATVVLLFVTLLYIIYLDNMVKPGWGGRLKQLFG